MQYPEDKRTDQYPDVFPIDSKLLEDINALGKILDKLFNLDHILLGINPK